MKNLLQQIYRFANGIGSVPYLIKREEIQILRVLLEMRDIDVISEEASPDEEN